MLPFWKNRERSGCVLNTAGIAGKRAFLSERAFPRFRDVPGAVIVLRDKAFCGAAFKRLFCCRSSSRGGKEAFPRQRRPAAGKRRKERLFPLCGYVHAVQYSGK